MKKTWAILLAAAALLAAAGLAFVPGSGEAPEASSERLPGRSNEPVAPQDEDAPAAEAETIPRPSVGPAEAPRTAPRDETPRPTTGSVVVRLRGGPATIPFARVRLTGPAGETVAGALFPAEVSPWRLEKVPPGAWSAWVVPGSGEELGPFAVDVRAGEESALVVELLPGLAVSIRVLDEHGDPIPRAEVSIVPEGAPPIAALEERTDDAGSVVFQGLAAGRHLVWIEGQEWEVELRSDDAIELRLAEPCGEH